MFPLYGRFNFGTQISLDVLIERLQQVSRDFLGGTPFHAYLITKGGQTYYGLKEEELRQMYQDQLQEVQTISSSAATADRRVVRVHIHFDPLGEQAKGQFVIACATKKENEDIKSLLLGTPIKVSRLIRSKEEEREGEAPVHSSSQQYLAFTDTSEAFQTGVITLSDNFYFDRNLSVYTLLALLDELSDRFMDYRSFHAQLETSDGDYYFDLQRDEMRYMFNQRRHTLLSLYLNVTNRDGHWIDLMLSFHPLATGPNAVVEISAPGSRIDDITRLIWDALAVESEINFPADVDDRFSFDPQTFSIGEFIGLFNRISQRYVFQVPPVAQLHTRQGKALTGLSFFQLEKRYTELSPQVESLAVDITQVITGQNCRLELAFHPQPQGRLQVMLGDGEKHLAIRQLVMGWFQAHAQGTPGRAAHHEPDLTRPERCCLLFMKESGKLTQKLRYEIENSLATQGITSFRDSSQDPEEAHAAIKKGDILIFAIEGNAADVLYRVGLAHALNKPVFLLLAEGEELPPELSHFPHLVFDSNFRRIDKQIAQITEFVARSA